MCHTSLFTASMVVEWCTALSTSTHGNDYHHVTESPNSHYAASCGSSYLQRVTRLWFITSVVYDFGVSYHIRRPWHDVLMGYYNSRLAYFWRITAADCCVLMTCHIYALWRVHGFSQLQNVACSQLTTDCGVLMGYHTCRLWRVHGWSRLQTMTCWRFPATIDCNGLMVLSQLWGVRGVPPVSVPP